MIASVVVTLEERAGPVQGIIDEICNLAGVEVGDFAPGAHRIPMVIDSPSANAIEETTRRLQDCHGVAFVDVVFVHLEDESEPSIANSPEGAHE